MVHGLVPEAEQVVGELLGGVRLVEHGLGQARVAHARQDDERKVVGNALQRGDAGRVELQHDDAGERLRERGGDRTVDLVVVGALHDRDHDRVARRLARDSSMPRIVSA